MNDEQRELAHKNNVLGWSLFALALVLGLGTVAVALIFNAVLESRLSSDANSVASSYAQAPQCFPHTSRRDPSARRRWREQCACPSTAHTA